MIANICITGGSEKVRNSLLLQNCKQSLSNGIPVIVIHENNYCLAYDIKHAFQENVIADQSVKWSLSMSR